uniref:MADF domain-containing protein n=1 Tax=Timema shepardi TaxID=629360 RepID=A0A7R9G7E2_TIMSH|nr:unnamed protein product [Timema shepardi]
MSNELLIELVKGKNQLFDLSSSLYNNNIAKRKAWNEIGKHLEIEGVICKDRWEQLRSQHRKHLKKIKTKNGRSASSLLKWKYQDQMDFLKPFMKDSKILYSTLVHEDDSISNDEDEEGGCTQGLLQDGEGNDMVSQQNAGSEDEVQGSDENIDDLNNVAQRNGVVINDEISRHTTNCSYKSKKCQKFMMVSKQPPEKESATRTLMKYLIETNKKEENNRIQPNEIDQFFSLMANTVKRFSPVDQHFIKTKVFNMISEVESKYLIPQNSIPFALPRTTPSPCVNSSSSASVPHGNFGPFL